MVNEEDLKKRFAISPMLDLEIDVGGMGWVGLTPSADHELRLGVTAAVIARFGGYRSIDYLRKNIAKTTVEHQSRDSEIRKLLSMHIHKYDQFYRSFPPREGERIGIFAFDMALIRSRQSIGLMLVTARQGFLIEPCLIARSLVEQFAYAVKVWPETEDGPIFSTRPQSVISSLKPIIPEIGQAYGMLSRLSHYHPELHYSFIGGSEECEKGESSTVIQRSWQFKIPALAWVFFSLSLKYKVFRHCYGAHVNFNIIEELNETVRESYDSCYEGVELPIIEQVRRLL